jgi:Mg2+/citrate symporter
MIAENKYQMDLSNLLSGLIGAIIGVIGAFALQWWTGFSERRRIKKVIDYYLQGAVLDNANEIIADYNKLILKIPKLQKSKCVIWCVRGIQRRNL